MFFSKTFIYLFIILITQTRSTQYGNQYPLLNWTIHRLESCWWIESWKSSPCTYWFDVSLSLCHCMFSSNQMSVHIYMAHHRPSGRKNQRRHAWSKHISWTSRCLFSSQNSVKFFKILRHIESLDTCIKY